MVYSKPTKMWHGKPRSLTVIAFLVATAKLARDKDGQKGTGRWQTMDGFLPSR